MGWDDHVGGLGVTVGADQVTMSVSFRGAATAGADARVVDAGRLKGWSSLRTWLGIAVGFAVVLASVITTPAALAATGSVLSGGNYGFNFPHGVAFDGTHVWISNEGANSVTELNPTDGSFVRTLSGGNYGFNLPYDIVFDGQHLWITNAGGNSITEVNASDGSWIRTVSAASYGFNYPYAAVFDGAHIWVANYYGNSVTGINVVDGSRVRTLFGSPYRFNGPSALAFDGSHVWVTNSAGNSVTAFNSSDGTWARTLSASGYRFNSPSGISFDGGYLWVTNQFGNSVTLFDSVDGSFVRVLTGGSFGFNGPIGITFDGSHMWITNQFGNSVTEVNTSDATWVKTLSGGSYGFNNPFGISTNGPRVWVSNLLGNSVTLISTADSTATSLALSAANINNGVDTLVATATVTDVTTPAIVVNSGTVQFQVDGVSVGTPVPVSSAGVASFVIPTATLTGTAPVGTPHVVTAVYDEGLKFAASTSLPATFTLVSYSADVQSIQTSIGAGTLLISTPYTATAPLMLPPMSLNDTATGYSTSAAFTGITVADTRPGVRPYTLSAIATNLVKNGVPSPGFNETINAQNVGLDISGLTSTNVTPATFVGSQATTYAPCAPPSANCQNLTGFNNVAATHVAAGALGSAGLGGENPHPVLHANSGLGTTVVNGTLTITAPTNTVDGTYSGIITFNIIGS